MRYRIECIPNISTADEMLLQSLSQVIDSVPEVDLRFVDPGKGANRTVFTYLGPAMAVFQATKLLFEFAQQHIDMRSHQGVHPRMGAVDVCPFVLLDDKRYETEFIQDVERFALEISQDLKVALYGYEKLAKSAAYRNLAAVRKGEYEGLSARFAQGDLPDFGPQQWDTHVAMFGATAIGVRELMVAYNVNLAGLPNDQLLPISKKIAGRIRERDGGMPGVKSIGWYLPDFEIVQVSCNLTKPEAAGVCEVFERVQELAREYGCEAPSSELIGCIPRSQFTTHSPEQLGFGTLKPFNDKRILPL